MDIHSQTLELDRFLRAAAGQEVEIFEMHERVFHKNVAFPEGKLLSFRIECGDTLVLEIQTAHLKSTVKFESVHKIEFGCSKISTALSILDSNNRLYLVHVIRNNDVDKPPYHK